MVDIYGEDADDAAAFTTGAAAISSRTRTTATVAWSLPESSGASAWMIGYRGTNQRTPDLAAIVQEIVDRAGWAPGNAMAFTLQHDGGGLGSRVVVAQDDDGDKEAVLYVDWSETVGVVQDGLVAEWRFDEGTGQQITDQSGNGHHGRLGSTTGADAADPTWTAQGLSFDGGDFVEHDTAGISGGAARTVLAVVKPGPSATFGLEWPGAGQLFERWTLRNLGTPAKIRLEVAEAGHTTAFDVPAGTWMFVGATQSSSNLDSCIVYFDGSSEAVPVSATLNTQGNLSWARQNLGTVPMEAAYGLVYDRALSPAEVEQNRQALKAILAARGISLP